MLIQLGRLVVDKSLKQFNDKGQGHIKLLYLHFLKPLLHSIAIDNILSNLDENISILIPLPLF